jgi:peptidoglycan/LPS O-acetylase OafA/YrhL
MRNGDRFVAGFGTYTRRRAFRIIPPYWVALAISCAVVAGFTGRFTGQTVDGRAALVHALLLQDVLNSAKPNGAFWSIAIEWQVYFLFPVLLLIWRRAGGAAMVAATTAAVVGSYVLADSVQPFSKLLDLTPQFLALFAFGVTGAHVLTAHGRFAWLPWTAVGTLLAATLTGLLLWWRPETVEARFFWVDLLAGAAAAALFAGWAKWPQARIARLLSSRPSRWLGQSSYSLYLLHLPILGLVYWGLVAQLTTDNNARFRLLLLVGVPAAVAGSRVFWWWFERPFMEHRTIRGLARAWRCPPVADPTTIRG